MRPGFFRIDEVRGQRRNPAPVVDSGVEQFVVVRRGKIRRRLKVDLRHEKARHRDGAQHLAPRRFRPVAHRNLGLDAEILHDHFLDVTVAPVQFADGEQRVHAVFRSFADSDQQARW